MERGGWQDIGFCSGWLTSWKLAPATQLKPILPLFFLLELCVVS